MIYTSYYANKHIPDDLKKVSISLYPPRWFSVDDKCRELYPSKKLLEGYKNNTIDEKEYTKIYRAQLDKLDANDIANRFKDSILFCYEKPSDFCHRHIVRDWLSDNGYDSVELPNKLLKIAVVGSMTIDDYGLISDKLKALAKASEFVLITGGAPGVDTLVEKYGMENDIKVVTYKPKKRKDNKSPHRIRNEQIVSNADIILAFWDGVSRGTKSILDLARDAKKEVIIVKVNTKD